MILSFFPERTTLETDGFGEAAGAGEELARACDEEVGVPAMGKGEEEEEEAE